MKKFIKKIVIGGILFYIFILLILIITSRMISRGNYFSLPKGVKNIVLGHSHSGCAINDTLVPGFYNLSQNTEGYPYSYFKAKKLMEHNPQLRRIFIEFTNNQFSNFAINRIWGDYLSENMPRNIPIVDPDFAISSFFKNKNPYKITKTIFSSAQKNYHFLMYEENYIEYIWRGYRTPARKFERKEEKRPYRTGTLNPIRTIDTTNLQYLKALRDICYENKVEFYFIRSPKPKGIEPYNDANLYHYYDTYFSEVPFLDFKEFPLPDSKFADERHLNLAGRKEFSMFFNSLIQDELLNKKNIGEVVKNAIENYKGYK